MNAQTLLLPSLNWSAHVKRKTCGVYMLMLGEAIQYIGQSTDVDARISGHRNTGVIRFDSVRVSVIPESELEDTERALIEKHQPPFNTVHTDRKRVRPRAEKKLRTTVYTTKVAHSKWGDLAKLEKRSYSSWLENIIAVLWEEKFNPPTR